MAFWRVPRRHEVSKKHPFATPVFFVLFFCSFLLDPLSFHLSAPHLLSLRLLWSRRAEMLRALEPHRMAMKGLGCFPGGPGHLGTSVFVWFGLVYLFVSCCLGCWFLATWYFWWLDLKTWWVSIVPRGFLFCLGLLRPSLGR